MTTTTTPPCHPVADLFPLVSGEEFDALVESVRDNGLEHAVVLDGEGRVLDGRNRLRACEAAGVEPRFITYRGDDPEGWALRANVQRRNLTKGQSAVIAAKAMLLAAGKTPVDQRRFGRPRLSELDQESVGRAVGVSQTLVSQAYAVMRHAPDLVDAVVVGETSLDAAYEEASRRRASEEAARAKAEAEEAERRLAAEQRKQEKAEEERREAEAGASAERRERADRIRVLVNEGKSQREIAEEMEMSRTTLQKEMKHFGIVSQYAQERAAAQAEAARAAEAKAAAKAMPREERAEQIRELGAQGLNREQVCERLGIGMSALKHYIRDFDLDVKPAEDPRVQAKRERMELLRELASQNLPREEICTRIGISDSTLTAYLGETGIELVPEATRIRALKAERAREMAEQRYTSDQIAQEIGMSRPALAVLCKDFGFDVPADRALAKGAGKQRVSPNEMFEKTALSWDGEASVLRMLDLSKVDPEVIAEWWPTLDEALKGLVKFHKKVKALVVDADNHPKEN